MRLATLRPAGPDDGAAIRTDNASAVTGIKKGRSGDLSQRGGGCAQPPREGEGKASQTWLELQHVCGLHARRCLPQPLGVSASPPNDTGVSVRGLGGAPGPRQTRPCPHNQRRDVYEPTASSPTPVGAPRTPFSPHLCLPHPAPAPRGHSGGRAGGSLRAARLAAVSSE